MNDAPDTSTVARACAAASTRGELWRHSVLQVHFLKKSQNDVKKSTLLTKWDLEEETIMEWANRWSSEEYSNIPTFELCMRERGADIVVELNGKVFYKTFILSGRLKYMY